MVHRLAEDDVADNLFYVFVNLPTNKQRAEFHVVPSQIVAEYVKSTHQEWPERPGRKGQVHNDNPLRQFADRDNRFLEAWPVMEL
jgi:hypothetical protein